jgi:NTP pyrophosphatase (non-canonical NTP hydrolase)
MTIQLRPIVRWFAEQMELKLLENEHKGGWQNDSPEDLMARVFEEAQELRDTHRTADAVCDARDRLLPTETRRARRPLVVSEAADVANMAMMVADHYREGGPSEDQGKTLHNAVNRKGDP